MDNQYDIEHMIETGELSVMTECAYGKAIAAEEKNNTLNKNKPDTNNDNK